MAPMTLPEAAVFLRTTPSYLRKLVQRGQISYSKPTGGKILFKLEDVEAFLCQGRHTADFEKHAAANEWLNAPLADRRGGGL